MGAANHNARQDFIDYAIVDTSGMSSCAVGVPLIAVNPFQDVAELYDSKMVNRYKSGSAVEIKV